MKANVKPEGNEGSAIGMKGQCPGMFFRNGGDVAQVPCEMGLHHVEQKLRANNVSLEKVCPGTVCPSIPMNR